MLADVFHWRQICSAARRIMRVHLDVGKKAMIVTILLVVENGARRLCLIALCTREVSDNSDSR